jgi:hypothetical protein
MGVELAALIVLMLLAAAMCLWAAGTAEPREHRGQHREAPGPAPVAEPRPELASEPEQDRTRVIRWYDHQPWSDDPRGRPRN